MVRPVGSPGLTLKPVGLLLQPDGVAAVITAPVVYVTVDGEYEQPDGVGGFTGMLMVNVAPLPPAFDGVTV